jgi:hypothetical protein
MKTQEITTNKNWIASFLFAIIILLSGCNKSKLFAPRVHENETATSQKNIEPNSSIEVLNYYKSIDLMAGEHLYKVGTVEIIDKNNGSVEVRYTLSSSWKLHSIKLFLGNMSSLPIDMNGECIPELFPYKQLFPSGGNVTTSSILIAKSTLPRSGIIAANAKIINTTHLTAPEDAWGIGTRVVPSGTGMYSNYNLLPTIPPVQINPIKNI